MLDSLIPAPRKVESNSIDLAATSALVWDYVRHADFAEAPLVRALFALRTLPSRIAGAAAEAPGLRIDDLRSTVEQPGFQLLGEEPSHAFTVGAIGKVWQLDIPFMHVDGPDAYARFAEPGWVKVAWAIRVEPLGDAASRLTFDLRVDATDDASWTLFERYWLLIGPGSHFIRHSLLTGLRRRFGDPDEREEQLVLSGDDWLPDAAEQMTLGITIQATPEAIWPWLVQMGCRRAGFYSIDALDNGGTLSAREIHPELQQLAVGDVIPATPEGSDGFEVLAIEANRALVLGGLFEPESARQLPFASARPQRFWQVTWAFVLERRDAATTRLHVRARAAFAPSERLHVAWIRPVHALMQTTQLRALAARAEGRLAPNTLRDVADGISGATIMALAWFTSFMRPVRNHWGLSADDARLPRAGDDLVPEPRWSWTHAVEIDATPAQVWPWIAQLGADRGGFYSYQWLENLAGCGIHNAEAIHDAWAHRLGDALVLHPSMPPLRVVTLVPGQSLIAYGAPDERAREAGKPWVAASWAFLVEPLGTERCRVVSRFRADFSADVATRLKQGPTFLEPIGFAMDRRMLLGIRERVLAQKARARVA